MGRLPAPKGPQRLREAWPLPPTHRRPHPPPQRPQPQRKQPRPRKPPPAPPRLAMMRLAPQHQPRRPRPAAQVATTAAAARQRHPLARSRPRHPQQGRHPRWRRWQRQLRRQLARTPAPPPARGLCHPAPAQHQPVASTRFGQRPRRWLHPQQWSPRAVAMPPPSAPQAAPQQMPRCPRRRAPSRASTAGGVSWHAPTAATSPHPSTRRPATAVCPLCGRVAEGLGGAPATGRWCLY